MELSGILSSMPSNEDDQSCHGEHEEHAVQRTLDADRSEVDLQKLDRELRHLLRSGHGGAEELVSRGEGRGSLCQEESNRDDHRLRDGRTI